MVLVNGGFGGTIIILMQAGNCPVTPLYDISIWCLVKFCLVKAIEIDDNDFEMHLGVETVQVPNSNDDSDYFKVMIDETIIHSSNFRAHRNFHTSLLLTCLLVLRPYHHSPYPKI